MPAVLTKVQYECLPTVFSTRKIWVHIGISFLLNWLIAPMVMLGLAWATLPEASMERERKGVILVGVGACLLPLLGTLIDIEYALHCSEMHRWVCLQPSRVIHVLSSQSLAMVLIWTGLAQGDIEYCAILVGINSLLQVRESDFPEFTEPLR